MFWFGKFIVGILTTFLTFIAAYELLSENRNYPYFSAEFRDCSVGIDENQSEEANIFFHSNIENSVYVDLLLYESCYDQTPVLMNFETKSESELQIASVALKFQRKKIHDNLLAFAGEPGMDVDAERIRGIFFLKGEIEGGWYDLNALPVPYSPEMQRKFTCSQSLSNASSMGSLKLVEAYIRSCIFERPWDSWGWSNVS